LPNAWDAISALIVETPASLALLPPAPELPQRWAIRRSRVQRDEMLEAVARIARVVKVPVTADLEAGYANTPREIADFARATIATGAVGLNFEDVTGDDETSSSN